MSNDSLFGHLDCYHDIINAITSNENVLITGATGTGKSWLAKQIHAQGPRANKRFVAVPPASLSDGLFETELFGHVKGAYTGAHSHRQGLIEYASGGTICLEDVTEMSLGTQAKILQFLDDKAIRRVGSNEAMSVDVRVIATTNRDLDIAVSSGQLREDLFYRLNEGFLISLPTIDKLPSDYSAKLLAEKVKQAREKHSLPPIDIEIDGLALSLIIDSVRGNHRGINKLATWMAVNNIKKFVPKTILSSADVFDKTLNCDLGSAVSFTRKEHISRILESTNFNHVVAAKLLNISRNTLTKYIKDLKITVPRKDI
jgi:two-component system, NtrC family, response regulator GlrR